MKTTKTHTFRSFLQILFSALMLLGASQAFGQGTISGSVTLVGNTAPTGYPVVVRVFTDPGLTISAIPSTGNGFATIGTSSPNTSPYPYTLGTAGGVFAPGTYYVVAFVDFDGNNLPGPADILSASLPAVNILGANVGGVNRTIDINAQIFTDLDLDNLFLLEELFLGTNPGLADTDDDGVNDFTELFTGLTSPVYSGSPRTERSVTLGSALTVPNVGGRFNALSTWTVEAWVRPAGVVTGSVIRNRVSVAPVRDNMDLRLDANVPSIRFHTPSGIQYVAGGTSAIPAGEWTHLAGVWNPVTKSLQLLINGTPFRAQTALINLAAIGAGATLTLGDVGFAGHVDEVRIWSVVRTAEQIANNRDRLLNTPLGIAGLVANYRFDDGGATAEDSVNPMPPSFPGSYDFVATFDSTIYYPHLGMDDSDGNGLADWWEQLYFGALGQTPGADDDGDQLTNLTEFLVGTNPLDEDTDNDGVLDRLEDFDSDGLTNLQEQTRGTHPKLADTDDDGLLDGDVSDVNPASSLAPLIDRVLTLDGLATSYVETPRQLRFGLGSFTLQAWVNPTALGGTILRRQVQAGVVNYQLNVLGTGQVQFSFVDTINGTETLTTPLGQVLTAGMWKNVAASFDAADGRMRILFDGVEVATKVTTRRPATNGVGPVFTRMGEGFNGSLDEVAIHNVALTPAAVTASLEGVVASGALVSYYRFDDGTSATGPDVDGFWFGTSDNALWWWGQVEEFAEGFANDWLNDWRNAGTLRGNVQMGLAPSDAPVLFGTKDSNGDGIPDWWYIAYGISPTGPSVAGLDWDNDGLTNFWEYVLGSNPNDVYSLDVSGILTDAQVDSDGDGLSNEEELILGTNPSLADTDDDGLQDGDASESLATDSRFPAKDLVLSLDGSGHVLAPNQSRFTLDQFTLMAWVNPSAVGGELITRQLRAGTLNYSLRQVALGQVEFRFTAGDGSGDVVLTTAQLLPVNQWTHVAASFDKATGMRQIFFNGTQVAAQTTVKRPGFMGFGATQTVIGRGLSGEMDEVGFFNRPLSIDEIRVAMKGLALQDASGMVAFYSFDDGTSATWNAINSRWEGTSGNPNWHWGQVQDFAAGYENDAFRFWRNAATLVGQNTVMQAASADAPVQYSAVDSNGDGIPDSWYIQYGFDPNGPSIAYQDNDGDGLSNMQEFLLGYNPLLKDSDNNGVPDGEEDFDGDGLTNLHEQNVSGTRVDIVDTDDDGYTDWEETTGKRLLAGWAPGLDVNAFVDPAPGLVSTSNPLNALDPIERKSLLLDGTGHVVLQDQARHSLRSWTLQGWIRPTLASDGGVIVSRRVYSAFRGNYGINYELGLEPDGLGNLRLYARYVGVQQGGGTTEVRLNGTGPTEVIGGQNISNLVRREEWTHVAATYDAPNRTFRLYVDGAEATRRSDATEPVGLGMDEQVPFSAQVTIGGGHQIVGVVQNGFEGNLDDVMIIGGAAVAEEVLASANRANTFSAAINSGISGTSTVPDELPTVQQILQNAHVPKQVVVRFAESVTPAQVRDVLAAQLGLTEKRAFDLVPVWVMTIADGTSLADKLTALRAHPLVSYAEPNLILRKSSAPNDTLFGSLWAMENTGQTGGTADADIDATTAWSVTTGDIRVRVAVIDSGIDYNHPDLAANMWPGRGYDFYEDLGDPADPTDDDLMDDDPMDEDGHGTHVAGTIGALGNNNLGVVGVNWRTELMAIRFLGPMGGTTEGAIASIEYAVKNGARISNNSWGGNFWSSAIYDAVAAAGRAGHLFIAAAGNDGLDADLNMVTPSSFNLPNMIVVAASDHNDQPAFFTNFGTQNVHLAAPGVDILSTWLNAQYNVISGTSMASPHVAGVAALILSQNPQLSIDAVKNLILSSVDTVSGWDELVSTGGRLNAGRALAGRGVTVAYFNFNDGGETVQDFTMDRDWENEWAHAGVFYGGASFDASQKYDEKLDSNSDGIPDWWTEAYGFDPMGPSIANVDSDGDGITNFYEYLAGTNPLKTDSFGDGIADGNRDLNGDGLTLSQEQQVGIHPILVDTDDDGVSDQQEIANGTNPLDSYDLEASNAASFAGNGRLRIRSERDIDVMSNWTVEAWVNPAADTTSGIITRRIERFPVNGGRWIDYELGLNNGVPYIRYAYRGQGGPVTVTVVPEAGALPTGTLIGGEWTHLAGVLDNDNHQLRLFVNGKRVGYQLPIVRPPMSVIGVFESTIGGGDWVGGVVANGFTGQIDAVRIWNYARNGFQIQDERGTLQPEFSNGTPDSNRAPVRLFNFDGTGTYAHNDRHSRDWLLDWMHAAEFQGDASRVAAVFPPLNLDYDDDALSDVDERLAGWLENRSESPYIHRALSFDGTGVVEVDELVDSEDTRLYGHETWTIETWVRPSAVPATQVSLVRRSGLNNGLSTFDLGLIPVAGELKPYIRFNRADNSNDSVSLQGAVSLPVGVGPDDWTHLAAVYANGRLSLYMDGVLQGTSTHTAIVPWTDGRSKLYLGSLGFEGELLETRIWNLERSATEIAENMRQVMLFNSSLLQNSFDATQGTYPGRPTTDNEDGFVVDLSYLSSTADGYTYLAGTQTHRFTVAAWVKMEPGAAGGVIAARAVDLALAGSGAQDFRYNHAIAINNEGRPVGAWEGQVTQLTSTTGSGTPPTVIWDSAQEVITRDVISDVDIRDGTWHHIALVGDSENVRLYIDGIMDREVPYYVFRALPSGFESFFYTYAPIDSVLRSADEMSGGRLQNVADGFGGLIDEVVYYNVPLTVEDLTQVKDFGLTRSEIRAGRLPISPVPEFAFDDGLPHVSLVSYLTFDGDLVMPFVPDLANEDQDYRILPLPTTGILEISQNSAPPVSVDCLRVFFDKMTGYFAAVDDGFTVENYIYRNDYGFAGLRLGGVDVIELDASQVIHIDIDLNNDGLPDWWYVNNGIDPSGPSVAHDDWDGDGLTNYQEFLAGTNPKLFDTLGTTGLSDYDQMVSGGGLTNGEVFDDGDNVPYGWELTHSGNPEIFDAYSDMDSDGWNALQEFLAGTDPDDSSDVPRPAVGVRVDWANAVAGTPIRWEAWDHAEMDGPSVARGTVSPGVGSGLLVQDVDANGVPVGAFKYGANYILFYADLDASGTWNNDANGFPEPAGFPDVNPVQMGSGDISGVRVGLSVEPNGYRRFHWTPVPGRNSYTVRVRRNTSNGMVMFFDRVIEGRSYLHEYDFKLGSPSKTDKNAYPNMPFELPNGTSESPGFELYVNTDPANSTTMIAQVQPNGATLWGKDWRTALSKPTLVAPIGSLSTAGTEFKWRQTTGVPTRFTLEIRPGSTSASPIFSKTIAVTPSNPDGTYSLTPDLFPGQGTFAHGLYFWRIISQKPGIGALVSSASDYSSFTVDTTSTGTGPYDISGTLWYMGRATPTHVIIQAYRSSALLGSPTQQVGISGAGDWRLSGLPAGTYYLLAFMDVNGNRTRENWEPMGLLKSPTPYAENYTLKAVTVGPNSSGHRIIVRDVDTDNDNFSDAWEMQTHGTLSTINSTNTLTAYPPHSTESGLAIAAMIPLNLDLDSDGDGVSDAMEMLLGTNPSVAGDFPATQVEDELIATGDGVSVAFAGVLANSPVVPGSVVVNGNSFQLTDNGVGVLTGPGLAGTINYATGAWTLNLGAVIPALGETITADYQHRIEDLLVIDGFNQSWLGFNLNTTLFNLARKIGVVVQYSTDMVTWYDVPGTRVDVGPGGQDWFTTPGGNVGPGPIFYRLRWFPLIP
jgi:subtilisin family serine protease